MIQVILNSKKVKLNNPLVIKIGHAVKKITGKDSYTIVDENIDLGQMFIIQDGIHKHYVAISSMGGGRNTFVFQPFATAYKKYLEINSGELISFLIVPTEDRNSRTDYQIFAYRCLLTLDVAILNLEEIALDLKPFLTLEEFISSKNKLKSKNPSNISSFIEVYDEKVIIYGKLSGANNTESLLLTFTAKKLASKEAKELYFKGIKDKETQSVSAASQKVLSDNNIPVIPNIAKFEDKAVPINDNKLRKGKYKINLKSKFKTDSECYLCDCKIKSLMVASHIHRVADIKNSQLDENIQSLMSNDADNGFWFCQNHDKMFEDGIIYFEKRKLTIATYIGAEDKEYILNSITKKTGREFHILPEHYNDKMESYLILHMRRVTKNID